MWEQGQTPSESPGAASASQRRAPVPESSLPRPSAESSKRAAAPARRPWLCVLSSSTFNLSTNDLAPRSKTLSNLTLSHRLPLWPPTTPHPSTPQGAPPVIQGSPSNPLTPISVLSRGSCDALFQNHAICSSKPSTGFPITSLVTFKVLSLTEKA